MSISMVAPQTCTVEFPRSQGEWLSVLHSLCIQTSEWQDTVALNLSTMYQPLQDMCPVHSECSLIQQLGTKSGSRWDNVPPFNYIGVSKPSCSACYLWIQAFNELGGRKFYTRSSPVKWCWPWGMPEVDDVREGLVAKVYKAYCAHLKERAYRDSYISDPGSWQGAHPTLSPEEEESFRSRLKARAQQSGGLKGMFKLFSVPPRAR